MHVLLNHRPKKRKRPYYLSFKNCWRFKSALHTATVEKVPSKSELNWALKHWTELNRTVPRRWRLVSAANGPKRACTCVLSVPRVSSTILWCRTSRCNWQLHVAHMIGLARHIMLGLAQHVLVGTCSACTFSDLLGTSTLVLAWTCSNLVVYAY